MKWNNVNRWLTLTANIGVLIGIALLIVEIRQNSELMSAEIHSMRAEGKANRQMDLANNGTALHVLAEAIALGFPRDPNVFPDLTLVDQLRLNLMYTAIVEVSANWHIQCQQGMLNEETCTITLRAHLADIIPMLYAVGGDLSSNTPTFIAHVQRIAREEGFVVPNDDGSFPERQ